MSPIESHYRLSLKQRQAVSEMLKTFDVDALDRANLAEIVGRKVDLLRGRRTKRHDMLAATSIVLVDLIQAWEEKPCRRRRSARIRDLVLRSVYYVCLAEDVIEDWKPNGYADDIWVVNWCMKQLERTDSDLTDAISREVNEVVDRWQEDRNE